jgi:NADPH:quinone reductase-like Zn-dependent oxidoreductase
MTRAITQHKIKPVIDQVFPLDQAPDAYRHLTTATHLGKLVITI